MTFFVCSLLVNKDMRHSFDIHDFAIQLLRIQPLRGGVGVNSSPVTFIVSAARLYVSEELARVRVDVAKWLHTPLCCCKLGFQVSNLLLKTLNCL